MFIGMSGLAIFWSLLWRLSGIYVIDDLANVTIGSDMLSF